MPNLTTLTQIDVEAVARRTAELQDLRWADFDEKQQQTRVKQAAKSINMVIPILEQLYVLPRLR